MPGREEISIVKEMKDQEEDVFGRNLSETKILISRNLMIYRVIAVGITVTVVAMAVSLEHFLHTKKAKHRLENFDFMLSKRLGFLRGGLVLVLPSNWLPMMRVKWLPLIANSFAVSGMVIAKPGEAGGLSDNTVGTHKVHHPLDRNYREY
ncbi:hypothetical protein Tco_1237531 [Tanacetum coccineum]